MDLEAFRKTVAASVGDIIGQRITTWQDAEDLPTDATVQALIDAEPTQFFVTWTFLDARKISVRVHHQAVVMEFPPVPLSAVLPVGNFRASLPLGLRAIRLDRRRTYCIVTRPSVG